MQIKFYCKYVSFLSILNVCKIAIIFDIGVTVNVSDNIENVVYVICCKKNIEYFFIYGIINNNFVKINGYSEKGLFDKCIIKSRK